MSKDIKELIARLEQERDGASALYDEVQREVTRGELQPQIAQKILFKEFGGHSFAEYVALKNKHIKEAQELLRQFASEDPLSSHVKTAIPLAVVLVLGISLIWSYSGITGYVFLSDNEDFYKIAIAEDITQTTTMPLKIKDNITSLRFNGVANGRGEVRVWLASNDEKYLVARYASEENSNLITGLFTASDDGLVPPVLSTDDNNQTQNTSANELDVLQDILAPVADSSTTVVNETNNVTPQITPPSEIKTTEIPVVILPSSNLPASVIDPIPGEEPSSYLFDKECIQTCNLPEQHAPYLLIIETSGDVTVVVDNIIYGVQKSTTQVIVAPLPAENETNQTIELNETNQTNQTITIPVQNISQNISQNLSVNNTENITQNVSQNISQNISIDVPINNQTINISLNETNQSVILPENVTNQTLDTNVTQNVTSLKQVGEFCIQDQDCYSNICIASVFEGHSTASICAADRSSCVENATLHASGDQLVESTCYASAYGGVWLASPIQGRFEIKNSVGTIVAIIDKYGSMAIRGKIINQTPVQDGGWVIKNAANVTALSIDEQGNMGLLGTVQTLVVPEGTSGGDFIIKDQNGVIRAVLTETGNVYLSGGFQQEVILS